MSTRFSEEDFEYADYWHDGKADRLAKQQIERSNKNMNENKPTPSPWEATINSKGQHVVHHQLTPYTYEWVAICNGPNAAANAALIVLASRMCDALLSFPRAWQGNLCSTATREEQVAYISRVIDWANQERLPIIKDLAAANANAALIAEVHGLLNIARRLAEWEADPDHYGGDLADLAREARALLPKETQ